MAEETRVGWWRASDGQMYPPESHPSHGQTATEAPGPQYGGPPPYPQTAWAVPQYFPPATTSRTPGLAVASLVLGIGSLLFSLIPFVGFSSVPFALCGAGLGIAGLVRSTKGDGGKGLSIAGIATSGVALLVSFVYLFVLIVAADDISDDGGVNTDPSNGVCDNERFLQDPDC